MGAVQAAHKAHRTVLHSKRKVRTAWLRVAYFSVMGTLEVFDSGTDAATAWTYFVEGGRLGGQYSVPGLRVLGSGSDTLVDILVDGAKGTGTFLRFRLDRLLADARAAASNATAAADAAAASGPTPPVCAAAPEVLTETLAMGEVFDFMYAIFAVVALVVSAFVLVRLVVLLRSLWRRYDRLRRENEAAQAGEGEGAITRSKSGASTPNRSSRGVLGDADGGVELTLHRAADPQHRLPLG